jgi:hypothetical protein
MGRAHPWKRQATASEGKKMNQLMTNPNQNQNQNRIGRLIEALENGALVEPVRAKARAVGKNLTSSRALKRHLKYIVPEMRLVLIKESGIKPKAITSAEDLDKFIEPLKHYSEENGFPENRCERMTQLCQHHPCLDSPLTMYLRRRRACIAAFLRCRP